MSTRCQIDFIYTYKHLGEPKPDVERRRIYRHSDGYPDGKHGVIEELRRFYAEMGVRGVEYDAANFIFWGKTDTLNNLLDREHSKPEVVQWAEAAEFAVRQIDEYLNSDDADLDGIGDARLKLDALLDQRKKAIENYEDFANLGYGVCGPDEFHGDIEYFYEVQHIVTEEKPNTYGVRRFVQAYSVRQPREGLTERRHLKRLKRFPLKWKGLQEKRKANVKDEWRGMG